MSKSRPRFKWFLELPFPDLLDLLYFEMNLKSTALVISTMLRLGGEKIPCLLHQSPFIIPVATVIGSLQKTCEVGER